MQPADIDKPGRPIRMFLMPIYERISAAISLTLIGLALYFVLEFPAQVTTVMLFGSPLTIVSPHRWLMAILLGGLAMAGMDNVIRNRLSPTEQRLSYLATFWMLPGLLVILATQLLDLAPGLIGWVVGLLGVGLVLWLTFVAETMIDRPAWAYLWQQFLAYGLALAFFIGIYYTRTRSAVSATGILLVSGLVALPLLRRSPQDISRVWLFAAVIGLSLGQITWALNYWRLSAFQAGLLLLLIFYVLVGLARQYLAESFSPRLLWEFGLMAGGGLLVIFLFVP